MTLNEFVTAVAQGAGIDRQTARRFIDTYHSTVRETLRRGEEVKLSDFGVFSRQHRPAREVLNPKTGAPVQIDAAMRAKFKPSLNLNRDIQGE